MILDMPVEKVKFDRDSLILVTGATGYVGGKLARELMIEGFNVRCVARNPEMYYQGNGPECECLKGDLLDPESLRGSFEGVHTAYYLVHSMEKGKDFHEVDRKAAENFGRAAADAGVKRIIYLGGLSEAHAKSMHLRSRHIIGEILRESGVPVIEFRASIIIGAGSMSFEILRDLAERAPFFLSPRWANTNCQPIFIGDVIKYLIAVLDHPVEENKIYEIGGKDVSCYICLMQQYARLRRLRRITIPMPLLTPRLSSLSLLLIAPEYYRVGRWLFEGMRANTVVNDDSAKRDFDIRPVTTARAIKLAMLEEDGEFAETRWSERLAGFKKKPWFGYKLGYRYVDTYVARVNVQPDEAFLPITRIGGETGWYWGNTMWLLRGYVDKLVGGPGMRHCRPECDDLHCGDIVDCFRVEFVRPDWWLRFRADMKTPGRAWLDFEVNPAVNGSTIRISAIFDPRGLFGLLYWYVMYPFHGYIFRGMLKQIARMANLESELEYGILE
jgi:uncharacterized protein YbjT (DUF2867 family)